MVELGVQSKREITRTRIRVRTAMAAQVSVQGRYLGGRHRTGIGWWTRDRIPTGRTRRGAAARIGWSRIRRPLRS